MNLFFLSVVLSAIRYIHYEHVCVRLCVCFAFMFLCIFVVLVGFIVCAVCAVFAGAAAAVVVIIYFHS